MDYPCVLSSRYSFTALARQRANEQSLSLSRSHLRSRECNTPHISARIPRLRRMQTSYDRVIEKLGGLRQLVKCFVEVRKASP